MLAGHSGGPWILQAPTFLLGFVVNSVSSTVKILCSLFCTFSVCLQVSVQLLVLVWRGEHFKEV